MKIFTQLLTEFEEEAGKAIFWERFFGIGFFCCNIAGLGDCDKGVFDDWAAVPFVDCIKTHFLPEDVLEDSIKTHFFDIKVCIKSWNKCNILV